MKTIDKDDSVSDDTKPLALHIRARRQWYGETGLTQDQLAKLAGITPTLLGSYETRRELPRGLQVLIAISVALELPLQALIDPRHFNDIRRQVQDRLAARGHAPAKVPIGFRCPEHDS